MAKKIINTIATAHLDTVWNWTFEKTVSDYLLKTLKKNFHLFEKYPDYKFNFEGSYRYELIEEYYPEEFEKLKKYVALGRWNVCGSAFENGDVNIPSPEALIRNFLYGNNYFEKTFAKRSSDIFLPDCFGFGWSLPSVAAHCGLKGFTTQKLSWGSAYGVPFDIGKWYGPNGKYIFASLKPGAYFKGYKTFRKERAILEKLSENEKYGLNETCVFHGVGDRGGSPMEYSVKTLEREIKRNTNSSIEVRSAAADEIFGRLSFDEYKGVSDSLPEWKNELVLTDHGVGCYTSRAISKRWNFRAEQLAILAEKTAVCAEILGLHKYNGELFEKAWKRVIAHQFHDDITGTSLQSVYRRSWNDYALSMNQFENEYVSCASDIIDALDTSWCAGTPVAVHNSFERRSQSVVFASLPFSGSAVCVFDENENEVPSQLISVRNGVAKIAFSADVGAMGFRVYDVRACKDAYDDGFKVRCSASSLENEKYTVLLDRSGNVCSVFDKELEFELLKSPITFDLFRETGDRVYPAWNLKYSEVNAKKLASPELVYSTPLYCGSCVSAIKIVKKYGGSTFETVISLKRGAKVVEFDNEIHWHEKCTLLKTNFSFNLSNEYARYDLGSGSILRKSNTEKLYEVPAQKWALLADEKSSRSAFVVSDSKRGWDKPDKNTLRLTVLHTPKGDFRAKSRQSRMDEGLNRFSFALGSLKNENIPAVQKEADLFCSKMTAFITDQHLGTLPSNFSMISLDNESVSLRALKKSEDGKYYIARFNNLTEERQNNVRFSLLDRIAFASEVNGSEKIVGNAVVENKELCFDIDRFDIKAFGFSINSEALRASDCCKAALPYNTKIYSSNAARGENRIPYKQFSLPLELAEKHIYSGGIDFELSVNPENANAVLCCGQRLKVPENTKSFVLLGASLTGKREYTFTVGSCRKVLCVPDIEDRLGAWDIPEAGESAFIDKTPLAFEFTHAHTADGDMVGKQLLLYRFELATDSAGEIVLPNERGILIFGAVFCKKASNTRLLSELYDSVPKAQPQKIKPISDTLYFKLRNNIEKIEDAIQSIF